MYHSWLGRMSVTQKVRWSISWYSLTILIVNGQVLRQRLIKKGMMTNGSDPSELNVRLITPGWLRRPTKVLGGNKWVVGGGGRTRDGEYQLPSRDQLQARSL